MTIVIGLMLALLLLAAIGLGPERPRSLGPIPAPPHFEARVGGSQALAAPQLASIGKGVAVGGPYVSGARAVSLPTRREDAVPGLAVAPAQAVAAAGPATPEPAPSAPEAQPVSTGAPESAPAPVAAVPSPSSGSPETGGRGGPTAAGVTLPSEEEEEGEAGACHGTEYTVTVAFDAETIFSGSEEAEIVLRRTGSDGSEMELDVEGGLEDLNALLEQFAAEGECVTVVAEPLGAGDDAGAEAEAPEAETANP